MIMGAGSFREARSWNHRLIPKSSRLHAGNLTPSPKAAHDILNVVKRVFRFGALALAASLVLSACQTKVGLAASVGGNRLTDSALTTYVRPGAQPVNVSNSDGSSQTIVPKQAVVETWMQRALFDAATSAHGGARTDAETRAARSAVLGSHSIKETENAVGARGFTAKFGDLLVDREVAVVVLIQRLQKGIDAGQDLNVLNTTDANNAIIAAVKGAHPDIVVSPRYGTWDETHLALSADPNAGLPSFIVAPSGTSDAAVPAG
jgi:hypothetical protein